MHVIWPRSIVSVLLQGRNGNFNVLLAASALSSRSWRILEILFSFKIGIELSFKMMYAMTHAGVLVFSRRGDKGSLGPCIWFLTTRYTAYSSFLLHMHYNLILKKTTHMRDMHTWVSSAPTNNHVYRYCMESNVLFNSNHHSETWLEINYTFHKISTFLYQLIQFTTWKIIWKEVKLNFEIPECLNLTSFPILSILVHINIGLEGCSSFYFKRKKKYWDEVGLGLHYTTRNTMYT